MTRSILLVLALAFVGCTPAEPAEPGPDPTPEQVEVLPDIIPLQWLENLSGSISHHQEYMNQGMEGTTCDEAFTAFGANISGFEQNACDQCEMVFTLLLEQTADCLGDDILESEGELGLDLRQTDGEAVFWWYDDGGFFGWGAGWDELGTGTVTQNADNLTLDVQLIFDDPRNSNDGPSTSDGDDCGWFGDDRCVWNGVYTIDLQLELDETLIEWELEDVEE